MIDDISIGTICTKSGIDNPTIDKQSITPLVEKVSEIIEDVNSFQNITSDANDNLKIGELALSSNTTGNNNIAIGKQALKGNVFGGTNIAIGSNSLLVGFGDQNVSIGFDALRASGNSTGEVAVGYCALSRRTYGSFNCAIGAFAGHSLSNGSPLTYSANNVFIGYHTKALSSVSENEIVIGHTAIGAGSNTATLGNTSITKTILRGNVETNGSMKVGDNTVSASSANVGSLRYKVDANNSYCEMCMQTGASTYAWVVIKQNTW